MLGLPVGIGLAPGAAVVGRLKDGANLSVVGEATNLAARLQVHAKPREVLLSQETHRRLRNDLQAELEPLALKGFDHPVTVFRVPAPKTAVT